MAAEVRDKGSLDNKPSRRRHRHIGLGYIDYMGMFYLLTLSNPISLPLARSQALFYFRWESPLWIPWNYSTETHKNKLSQLFY
ncbi:hypothetical protein GDO78_021310 [Eleutherodactylus coqui]|uniref:Uncharacterized protein n=1 Tax=Eleutherodactylus coqui TaxID=57060 RepID=A0A8J6JUQ1_ELECQ|nr:hypothetical protein GDO78_021310 [Eleutherodactylus coqui]